MKVRAVYKTKEDFEAYLELGRLYEGFVIGVGYAYVEHGYQMPGNLNGFGHYSDGYSEDNRYIGFRVQRLDSSPEMVELSLRGSVSGEFSEITVMKGDTLSGLAKELGVSVDDLVRWNKLANPDAIKVGQVLLVDNNIAKQDRLMTSIINRREFHNLNGPSYSRAQDQGDVSSLLSRLLQSTRTPVGFIGYGNLVPTTIGGLKYTNIPFTNVGFWRGANGQYYNMSQAARSSGRGWNFRANSMNIAKYSSGFRYLRYGGTATSWITTGYSAVCFVDNPNWEDGLDTGFGAAGLIYWPIGVVYFGGKGWVKVSSSYLIPASIDWETERAERISHGDYSMAFWRPGRAVR